MRMMNSLKGDLGGLRPGLRLRSHSDPTHVHAPTIAFNPRERLLLCRPRPKRPPRRPRVPPSTTARPFIRPRARPCRVFPRQNTVAYRGSERVVALLPTNWY